MEREQGQLGALTPREREVLELVNRGLTNEEIARRLGITLDGAKYHVSQILSKLGVSSREEAAAIVYTRGWPWRRLAGAAVVAAALGGMALLAWSVLANHRDESEATPAISLRDVYDRALDAIAEPGIVFEATDRTVFHTDLDLGYPATRHWFYFDGRAARTEILGADDNQRFPTDHLAVRTLAYRGTGSRWEEAPDFRPCPGTDDMILSFLLHCYDLWAPEEDDRCIVVRDIEESNFRSTPTIAIGVGTAKGDRCAASDVIDSSGSSHEGTLHLDPQTYLPLVWDQNAGSLDFEVFYEYATLAIDEMPEGFFDPSRNTGIHLPAD